jgi:hypothetical protein
MPLSGLVDGEPVVSCLLTEEEWAQLKDDLRAKRRTATMRCGWKGLAKTSRLGTQYFAHAPGGDSCSAGESAQHLRAKAVIVEAIARAGWTAQTEVPGDGWVADVMATRGDVRVVFEVQWSRQDLAEYRHRQNRYLDSGIAGIAWFARHADGLPRADKQLPVFGLDIDDAGEATVMVGVASIPLAEAVDRLLTRRLQHREYVANGQPALVVVGAGIMGCYRCHKEFGVWTARQTIVEGRCGRREIRDQRPRVFAQHRAEALPEVRAAGEQMAQELGVAPGRIFRRYTQTAGGHYMAFTCPHCNATCGDMFVAELFNGKNSVRNTQIHVPATVVVRPHWCLAGDEGLCPIPPEAALAEYARLYAADPEPTPARQWATESGVSTIAAVGTAAGIPVHQAVARMFGRH